MSDIDELDSDVSSVFGEVLQSNWYNTGTESLSDNGAIYCRDLEQYAFQNQLVLDKRFYQPSGKVLVVVEHKLYNVNERGFPGSLPDLHDDCKPLLGKLYRSGASALCSLLDISQCVLYLQGVTVLEFEEFLISLYHVERPYILLSIKVNDMRRIKSALCCETLLHAAQLLHFIDKNRTICQSSCFCPVSILRQPMIDTSWTLREQLQSTRFPDVFIELHVRRTEVRLGLISSDRKMLQTILPPCIRRPWALGKLDKDNLIRRLRHKESPVENYLDETMHDVDLRPGFKVTFIPEKVVSQATREYHRETFNLQSDSLQTTAAAFNSKSVIDEAGMLPEMPKKKKRKLNKRKDIRDIPSNIPHHPSIADAVGRQRVVPGTSAAASVGASELPISGSPQLPQTSRIPKEKKRRKARKRRASIDTPPDAPHEDSVLREGVARRPKSGISKTSGHLVAGRSSKTTTTSRRSSISKSASIAPESVYTKFGINLYYTPDQDWIPPFAVMAPQD